MFAGGLHFMAAIFCPRCHKNHLLSRIWAWLDSNHPKVVVTDAVPSAAPHPVTLKLDASRVPRGS